MTATIDPRIRERRIEVKREAGRKRLRLTLVFLCLLLLVGSAYLVVESPILDVDHVRIEGTQQTDEREVRNAIGIAPGAALVRVDLGAVRERVERVPWVRSAEVSRDLPGTLRVVVHERELAAFARRAETQVALLDTDGVVIADAPSPPDGIREVRGLEAVPVIGARLPVPARGAAAVAAALPAALADRVVAIDVADGMTLVLAGGGEVRLCTARDVAAKGAAAVAVIERLGAQPFTYVDVCVPQAPVSK